MDVIEAIQTTGACRYFKPDPVPDDVLERLFDAARHGPQGGNRQPVRYIVVRDPALKKQLAEWYLPYWNTVLEMAARGEYRGPARMLSDATHMANHLAEIPVLVVVCAVLGDLARTDAILDRPGVVGGASVYPSVQNLMLAARNEGLGTTLTTILCAFEPRVKELLGIPPELITCATIALGYPERPLPKKLSRAPVSEIVFSDRYGEQLFPPSRHPSTAAVPVMADGRAQLERLAVEVPDLDAWIAAFEVLLGRGYRRSQITQATGEIEYALHPAGVELVSTPGRGPRLRSFHLRVDDLDHAVEQAGRLGWQEVDRFVVNGRLQVVVDAAGLRLVLLAPGKVT